MDMDSATDTDSEAGYHIQMPWSPGFRSQLLVTQNGSSLKEVEVALAVLHSVETRLLTKDAAYINAIRRACSTLVCAMRELASPDPGDRDGLIEVFRKISSEWSLSKLLAYRRDFRHIAGLSASVEGALVSWGDIVLANISRTAVSIASCVHDTDGMKGTLARQEDDEAIRAASQLPYTWVEMVELLTSDAASRTILRISLRLTFAAYILHPQLSGVEHHVDTFTPSWMTKVSQTYSRIFSTESPVDVGRPVVEISLRDRILLAMILVLCSVIGRTSHSALRGFPQMFSPEVLYLICAVIHSHPNAASDNVLLPFAHPDGAQIVLLCWGEVVPWSWTIWRETGFTDVELITQLTAVWVCHVDALCIRVSRVMQHHAWQKSLVCASKSYPHDATTAITQLFKRIAIFPSLQNFSDSPTICSKLLPRSCWLMAQLLDPSHSWHVTETLKSMCCIFASCMVEGLSLDAREAIIETLTQVSTDELQATIRSLQEERSSRFLPMLESIIDTLQRDIHSAIESRAPLASATIRTICLAMNFVILCCGTPLNLCSGAPFSAFLSSLLTYASEFNTSCFSCHLLMAASALEGSRSDIPPKKLVSIGVNDVPWEIVLSYPRSDILVASCLSSCLLTVKNLENLHMCTGVEFWDYLRDVLLLILAEHYVGDEAPLSLLVASTICGALLALLCQIGDRLVTWTMCSPWAKNLCTELDALLGEDEKTQTQTRRLLKKELWWVGRRLAESLEKGCVGEQVEERGMEKVYYKGHVIRIVRKWKGADDIMG